MLLVTSTALGELTSPRASIYSTAVNPSSFRGEIWIYKRARPLLASFATGRMQE